jgi:hypothetical protein
MSPTPKVGPEAGNNYLKSGGKGYSAFFDGTEASIIKHSELFESKELTISFWIYLLKVKIYLKKNPNKNKLK